MQLLPERRAQRGGKQPKSRHDSQHQGQLGCAKESRFTFARLLFRGTFALHTLRRIMSKKVEMHYAIIGIVKAGELCYTTDLFDCVALGAIATDGNEWGYYFGHLTSHHYCKREDERGNAISQLNAFLKKYPQKVQMIAAINYEQHPDFTQSGGDQIPINIEARIVSLFGGGKIVGSLANQGLWQTGGASNVTFDPAQFALHGTLPENANVLNELRVEPNHPYKVWFASAVIEEGHRRAAYGRRRKSVKARMFSCCTLF
jgi:hypothetical protein